MNKALRAAFITALSSPHERADYEGATRALGDLAGLLENDHTRMPSDDFKRFKASVVKPARQYIPPKTTYANAAFYFLKVREEVKFENRADQLDRILEDAFRDRAAMNHLSPDELSQVVAAKLEASDIFAAAWPTNDGKDLHLEVVKGERLFRLIFDHEKLSKDEEAEFRKRGLIDSEGGIPARTSFMGFKSEVEAMAMLPPKATRH